MVSELEVDPFNFTLKVLTLRWLIIIFIICVEYPNVCILCRRPLCHTLPKAFSTSYSVATVDFLWVKPSVIISIILMSCCVVECDSRKPNCSSCSMFKFCVPFFSCSSITV